MKKESLVVNQNNTNKFRQIRMRNIGYQISIDQNNQSIPMIEKLFKDLNKKKQLKQLFKKDQLIKTDIQRLKIRKYSIKGSQIELIELQFKLSIVFSYYNFQNLTILNLGEIGLNNCQFTEFINMPKLTNLILADNKIHNFKPLTRANFPQLNQLSLNGNLAQDINILTKLHFKQNQMKSKKIFIDKQINPLWYMSQDINFIAKMELNTHSTIYLDKSLRVQPSKKYQTLLQKIKAFGPCF